VLVQRVAAETKTMSGIILPESAVTKMPEGVVIAVGPGRRTEAGDLIPMGLKVGDNVLLPEYGGSKVQIDQDKKKEFILFRHDDIQGILQE
jgi:chaperonin GroES